MRRSRYIPVLVAAAWSCAAWGQAGRQGRVMTLQECIRQGIEANYDVKLARIQRDVADNNVTMSQFLPVVNLNARQNHEAVNTSDHYTSQSTVKNDYATNIAAADASLSWRLFDGMGMFATRDRQKELLSQGELNLRNSIEGLVADIADQYYYLVTESERLGVHRRYLEISTLRYNQAQEKYNIGSISGLEMKQAKIDLNADSSAYVMQQVLVENAFVQLFRLMNVDYASQVMLGDTIIPNERLDLAQLKASAIDNNSRIQMARSGQRVSEIDLRSARAGRYPTLDFVSTYRMNRTSDGSKQPLYSTLGGLSWGFTASVPLFRGLDFDRRVRNAKLGVQSNELLYDRTVQSVTGDMLVQYNTYRRNLAMIGFVSESADVALLNLEAAMEMYRLGSMSGVEFREIQRSYLQAEERKLDAMLQTKTTEINLLYLSGQLLDTPAFK